MNTNRISTDIKHAKEALEKKLDSLQLGMDGIPNLLAPSFDSIKNVLASITAKVDNVRGGVDLNHTTLTDLQNRLTKVEGSVGQVKVDVGKVKTDVALCKPPNYAAVKILTPSKPQGTILDVSGKGKLLCIMCGQANNVNLKLKVDGVMFAEIYNNHASGNYGGFLYKELYKGIYSSSYGPNYLETDFGNVIVGQATQDDFGATATNAPLGSFNTFKIGLAPIQFKSKIVITATGTSWGPTIAYTLE